MNSLIVIAFFTTVAFGANPAQRFVSRQIPCDRLNHDNLQRLADHVVTAAAATVALLVVTLLINAPFSFTSGTVYFLGLLLRIHQSVHHDIEKKGLALRGRLIRPLLASAQNWPGQPGGNGESSSASLIPKPKANRLQ